MNSIMKNTVIALLVVGIVGTSAFAGENFKKKHPRRAQVVNRANNEEKANDSAAASGKITEKQARKLDRQDQRIKRQEQRDAAAHGGHITKAEQNKLNREENRVNAERTNMEKRDAAKTTAPTGGSSSDAPTTTH